MAAIHSGTNPNVVNRLFYGDNLEWLRDRFPSCCVRVVYSDAPWNSKAKYHMWFRAADGTRSDAQVLAYEDMWQWNPVESEVLYNLIRKSGNASAARWVEGTRLYLGESPMMAYLVWMAARHLEFYRVLLHDGTLWLHCDDNAEHFLRQMLDAIFGPSAFISRIVRQRQSAHNDAKQGARHFGRITDTILVYAKGPGYVWNTQYLDYTEKQLLQYRYRDSKGLYTLKDMSGPGGAANGNPEYEVMGVIRPWRHAEEKSPRGLPSMQDMLSMPTLFGDEIRKTRKTRCQHCGNVDKEDVWVPAAFHHVSGIIVQTAESTVPKKKQYLDEMDGPQVQNLLVDPKFWNLPSGSRQAVGWPTQKPDSLLELVIATGSNPGDLILDPFCGCGPSIVVASRLGRTWAGIDITHHAIAIVEKRLSDNGITDYSVEGRPKDMEAATKLAKDDKLEFQGWAASLVLAVPYKRGASGADGGIDHIAFFTDHNGKEHKVIAQVKAGANIQRNDVDKLAGVVKRECAAIGILITLKEPTRPMREDASKHGVYQTEHGMVPNIQILTIQEWFDGKRLRLPPGCVL